MRIPSSPIHPASGPSTHGVRAQPLLDSTLIRTALITFILPGIFTDCRTPEKKAGATAAVTVQAGDGSGGAPDLAAAPTALSEESPMRRDTLDVLRERLKTAASFFEIEPGWFDRRRLETLFPNSEAMPRDTSWRGNVMGERKFLLPTTFSDLSRESPLSCRTALLDAFVHRLFRETEIRRTPYDGWEYVYSRPLAGDTVLAALGCREFTAPGRYHRLERLPGKDSARWVPMSPSYALSANPRKSFCGNGLVLELRIEDGSSPWDSTIALMVESSETLPSGIFPFRAFEPGRISEKPGPTEEVTLRTIELVGSGPFPFERVWVEEREESRWKDDEEHINVVEARLFVALQGGTVVELADSIRNDPPDAGIRKVIATDLDLDGHPDFIVGAEYLETRILFLDDRGIRETVLLGVDQTDRGCC